MPRFVQNSGRMSAKAARAAWTAHITGEKSSAPSKYHNERVEGYASKHEADVATNLHALASCGQITDLREQVPIVLVAGKDGVAGVTYIADFVYKDSDGVQHVLDAKGVKTTVYKVKKRLAYLLLGIRIEEV